MQLKILVPSRILVDDAVGKVVAEGGEGGFCLLPGHVDYLAALVPGLLSFTRETGEEQFLAVDAGLLVKRGQLVLVSTGQAVVGQDLGTLRETVRHEFAELDERQRVCQSAIARLEAHFLRSFLDFRELPV